MNVAAAMEKTEKGELSLTGVTGMPVKKKGEGMLFRGPGEHEVSHLDCGCGVDESLFYFWMWKTWRLRGVGGAVVEPITSVHVAPRLRNVVHQGFQRWSGMRSGLPTFTGVLAASEDESREQSVIMQFRNLAAELKGIYAKREVDLTEKQLVGILLNHRADSGSEDIDLESGSRKGSTANH